MAKAAKIYHYRVRGIGTFPIDMLRYDAAHPATEEASGLIARTLDRHVMRNQASTKLVIALTSMFPPTEGRWESFLWNVVPGSLEVRS